MVLRLAKGLEKKKHRVFFDNFFSCAELHVVLKSPSIFAVATLKSNRSRGCSVPTDEVMRKKERGDVAQFTDAKAGLVICAWYDNRRVLTISNFLGKDPVSNCKLYDRKKKEDVSVPRPACIELYNKFMGGVDKADILLSLYRTKHRSKKWYHRTAFHLISLAAVNAFVMYREIGGSGSLVDFLLHDSPDSSNDEATIPVSRQRSLRANQVPDGIRYDKYATIGLCSVRNPKDANGKVVQDEHGFCAPNARFTCTPQEQAVFWTAMVYL